MASTTMPSASSIPARVAAAMALLAIAGVLAVVHFRLEHATAAREAALAQALADLRGAITRFQADTGRPPARLTDLTATDPAAVVARIDPARYRGPYLPAIPRNPYAPAWHTQPAGDPTRRGAGSQWRYTRGTIISRDYAWTRRGKVSQY